MLPTWSMYLVDKYHISADLKPRKKNGKKIIIYWYITNIGAGTFCESASHASEPCEPYK